MVKLSAPMLSMDASGTIAKTATFSKWKGRNYARSHVIPHNPKSVGQIGVRSMFKFLAQSWKEIAAGTQLLWTPLATALNISGFNAYMQTDLARWRNFSVPSKDPTAAAAHTSAVLNAWTATAGVRQISLLISLTTKNANWGAAIFRSPTGTFTATWDKCIAVVRIEDTNDHHFIDTPLAAAHYYYSHILFTDDGKASTESAEVDAIVA
jgi:hypothetical protein